jgi:UDP-N-acetylmuramyl pentapeptide phosphotransferase/UDP-N-acetylglucosamine-1-phosphate transferase
MIGPGWAAAVATVALWLGPLCNRRWVGWLPDDPPRPGRKQHQRPLPLAGVLLLPAVLPWLLAERQWLLLAGTVLATAIGFVDDRTKEHGRDLGWRPKAAGLMLATGLAAATVVAPWADPTGWLLAWLLVFVITNATNFLDNTDGTAAALAATSLLCLGGPIGCASGAAALAFLPWNWPRPRLFLGDSGAYLLGMLTGTLAAAAMWREPAAVRTVALQLGDFVQVMIARLWLAHPPWVGDRRHLTHVLQNCGLPRPWVAPVFAALALVIAQWRP